MKKLDITNWNRREHYEFFSTFDDPSFGIVSEIDCTKAYNLCKKKGWSFFAYYLHKSVITANKIEAFKYRINEDGVGVFDKVHASSTIGRKDNTFGFSFVPYTESFSEFALFLNKEINRVENCTGLAMTWDSERLDVIHYTSLPWTKITAVSHPKNFDKNSVPKITFGKAFSSGENRVMAVAINAHHGLMDGWHMAQFLEVLQKEMNE